MEPKRGEKEETECAPRMLQLELQILGSPPRWVHPGAGSQMENQLCLLPACGLNLEAPLLSCGTLEASGRCTGWHRGRERELTKFFLWLGKVLEQQPKN